MVRRMLIFTFGLVAYLAFFITFLYAIGFVSGFVVPKTIDDGAAGPLWLALLVNVGMLSVFAVQHTIMARPAFKRWWTRIVPRPIERSIFVLVTSAILLTTFWQWRPITTVIWDIQHEAARIGLIALGLTGWVIVLYSSFLIDHFDLFGLRQVTLALREQPYTQRPFMARSLYRLVRHPLMLGFLIAFWSTPTMTAGHLLFAAMTSGYIFFGIHMEERDLIAQHGEAYQAYRRRTPMVLPLPKRQAVGRIATDT